MIEASITSALRNCLASKITHPRPQLDAASISAPITAIQERRNDCRSPATINGDAPGTMAFRNDVCPKRSLIAPTTEVRAARWIVDATCPFSTSCVICALQNCLAEQKRKLHRNRFYIVTQLADSGCPQASVLSPMAVNGRLNPLNRGERKGFIRGVPPKLDLRLSQFMRLNRKVVSADSRIGTASWIVV
jgi:hypothetical protein